MSEINISNVINISVSQAGAGAGAYNTSNLACFTSDAYNLSTFGSLGYKIYVSAQDVATDFGSASATYLAALQVFSQQPNILANRGYFVAIPMIVEVQRLSFSSAPVSGHYVVNFGGHASANINFDDTAPQIQAKIQAILGLEQATVTGTAATHIDITFKGYYGNAAIITITSNTLNGGITVIPSEVTAGETLAAAITRTTGLVQYFGIGMPNLVNQTDMLAAAAVVQTLLKMAYFLGNSDADVAVAGKLDLLRSNSYTQSRGLYYVGDATLQSGLDFQWSYMGRAQSTVFEGSNTTQNMHLKSLIGVDADSNLDQTKLDLAQAAGADCYPSIQGIPKVFSSGENTFFDRVYNLLWFVGALQIAGFNYLATTSTKIPQTEQGMDGLKGSYRSVCEQAVTNQYAAPGTWNSPDTFGEQTDFYQNIQQRGYYIYSAPIGLQAAAARAAREAPLIQIAIKEAGAIDSSTVLVYVNA